MLSFMRQCWERSHWPPFILVACFAIVVPALKLLLLLLGEAWRKDPDPSRVAWSRRCISFVQVISKWACPDMFAYVLMMYLIRTLPAPIESSATADVGFPCFAVFCICSTVSTMAVPVPERPLSKAEQNGRPSTLLRWLGGERGVALAVGFLAVAFAALFVLGACTPCLAMHWDDAGVDSQPIPWLGKLSIKALDLGSIVNSEVTIVDCMRAMTRWLLHEGEWTDIVAWVVLGLFAMGCSALDMIALASVAYGLWREPKGETGGSWAIAGARVLKHLEMLDVLVTGILLTTISLEALQDSVLQLSLREGVYFLLAAELVHYAAFFLISEAVDSRRT